MSWNLIYQNDDNGVATFGDKSELLSAARDGKSIRISVISGDAGKDSHTFSPHTVIVKNEEVYAQYSHFGGDWSVDKALLNFTDPLKMIVQNFCSSGKVVTIYVDHGAAAPPTRTQWKSTLKWFSQD